MDLLINEIPKLILALLVLAEIIVRFTKTDKDDGFVERIGSVIRKIFDVLRLPNRRK